MLPFSVMRMWSLGLVGWGVFGLGVYAIYLWTKSTGPQRISVRTVDSPQLVVDRSEVRKEAVRSNERDPILAFPPKSVPV